MKANDKNLPASLLTKLLRYDPATGQLFWRARAAELFVDGYRSAQGRANNWNARCAGKPAFKLVNKKGHLRGVILEIPALAHRIVWAMETGFWPKYTIDHINGNPADNRIENLRDVPNAENHRNVKLQKNNRSGHHGVSLVRTSGRWRSRIKVDRKEITLGYFLTRDAAIAARKDAERTLGFHPNHGRAPLMGAAK